MGGEPKVLLEIDGVPMGQLVARALSAGGAIRVTLVGGDPAWAEGLGLSHRADRWPGEGPLGGLATALLGPLDLTTFDSTQGADVVVVAGCDQPWLDAGTVVALVTALVAEPGGEAAAGVDLDGRRQPLPAAWRRSAGPRLAELVERGERRLDAAFDPATSIWVPVEPAAVADVDRPDDLPAGSPRLPVDGGRRPPP